MNTIKHQSSDGILECRDVLPQTGINERGMRALWSTQRKLTTDGSIFPYGKGEFQRFTFPMGLNPNDRYEKPCDFKPEMLPTADTWDNKDGVWARFRCDAGLYQDLFWGVGPELAIIVTPFMDVQPSKIEGCWFLFKNLTDDEAIEIDRHAAAYADARGKKAKGDALLRMRRNLMLILLKHNRHICNVLERVSAFKEEWVKILPENQWPRVGRKAPMKIEEKEEAFSIVTYHSHKIPRKVPRSELLAQEEEESSSSEEEEEKEEEESSSEEEEDILMPGGKCCSKKTLKTYRISKMEESFSEEEEDDDILRMPGGKCCTKRPILDYLKRMRDEGEKTPEYPIPEQKRLKEEEEEEEYSPMTPLEPLFEGRLMKI